ncbi:hypothetical protein DES52_11495 [Deinococcus yavapaiensis KR-236]|uniref:AB hydrolase-1 domain-containing protein n=1 Tax=Deinococcus yavapaiensis KR-236 TaxID=694435 RepID=A0A318S663_9DEIO|nr:hypothetical protein DES52_11495 [Deinococcus yavapaiensis KR-236]
MYDKQRVPGGTRLQLELQTPDLTVPGLLLLPDGAERVPAALLLHGVTSRADVMTNSAGMALLRRRVASLALDLPMHGSRGNPLELQSLGNPLEFVRLWRLALDEAAVAVDFLGAHERVDATKIAIVGYSLGSFLSVTLAAKEPRLSRVLLAAGGDLPAELPFAPLVRSFVDPLRDVRKLHGRPLLMVNGRFDPVIRADQAQRLFDAANEPKELRWYEGGHSLPNAMTEEASDWLAASFA